MFMTLDPEPDFFQDGIQIRIPIKIKWILFLCTDSLSNVLIYLQEEG